MNHFRRWFGMTGCGSAERATGAGVATVRCVPDMTAAGRVDALIASLSNAAAGRPRELHLDLSAACRADTKLVAAMVISLRVARGAGTRLRITLSACLVELLSVCRVDGLLRARASVAETYIEHYGAGGGA